MPATAHIPDTCRGPRPLLRSRASGPQHHESTVHRDGLAGDEARILAREKQQHGSQILQRIAQRAAQRYALLQVRGTNVLVLDEPTNHLDLAAIAQLEHALESYDGALLLVTHDRRMLQNVRLDRSWSVLDGRVVEV